MFASINDFALSINTASAKFEAGILAGLFRAAKFRSFAIFVSVAFVWLAGPSRLPSVPVGAEAKSSVFGHLAESVDSARGFATRAGIFAFFVTAGLIVGTIGIASASGNASSSVTNLTLKETCK